MDNQLLLIFGASGDLTRRKLVPALHELFKQHLLPEHFAILGISRTAMTDDAFRDSMRQALSEEAGNEKVNIDEFLKLLHYISIETADSSAYQKVKERMAILEGQFQTGGNCIFYLATPPDLSEIIAGNLSSTGINHADRGWRRIIVEKPFGFDLKTARHLNAKLLSCFAEDQIYRIDHYLGKETVQNVMVTRFSNGIFEPLWNRNYIHHVEITSAENIGVENRGGYYEKSGALRDMIQNHLLQVLSLIAMEPPTQIHSTAIRNETLKILQAIRPVDIRRLASHAIRGQYTAATVRGKRYTSYREEKGVSPDSRTETYAALKLFIDNWRWGGVPFYIRTGKRLPTRVTELVVHFKPSPHPLFCFNNDNFSSDNQLVIRIQPDEGILLKIGMKVPGAGFIVQDVNMDFHYASLANGTIPEAYQRLLLDCMQGDSTLFSRGDAIEQSWTIVDPILKEWGNNPDIPMYGYPAGTWGPKQADDLIEDHAMTWRYPCKNLSDDGIYCEL